ncbi:MAG: molybdopterin oxidoreductase [Hadesarchaea archaeon DG-33-1]|nr:MAG: molybdopterin oxidoreductase [Hadesarchaea archaeon DG-33-1]
MKVETREITCIICPVGCRARVSLRNGEVLEIQNIECPRGEKYISQEVKAPMRDFFTTVRIANAQTQVLPVRSTEPVPKARLKECALELAKIRVEAPVRLGDVIVENILGLGIDIVATRDIAQQNAR